MTHVLSARDRRIKMFTGQRLVPAESPGTGGSSRPRPYAAAVSARAGCTLRVRRWWPGGRWQMGTVMLERDAVMAAIRGLLRDALGGRGGTLFVAGEAGLGKTTVLRYAVAAAGDRFRTGTGQADVGEAALPFGLIGQALDPLLGSQAATTGTAQAPAGSFYAVLARLRQAASQPLFLGLDDAHWADPDSLTLLRLICRRITELPVAVLVTARPWPPEALRAGEELAASHLAAVQHLAPLSAGAARAMLQGAVGDERDRVAALCAGNPLLLGQVAAALRAG